MISLTAIPLSLLAAVIVLEKFGVTLNTITLGGLAIAIGEVVDDAIIDVENIFRRLRENQLAPPPRAAFRVVLDASLEVRSAVVYATFIVALVFLPVLTHDGIAGQLFRTARVELYSRDPRLACGCPDGHTRPVPDCVWPRGSRRRANLGSSGSSRRSTAGLCRAWPAGPGSFWPWWD